jgi:hypothetical protein
MIEDLFKDPEISAYLSLFPKDHWNKCIYFTLLYGIRSIKRETSYSKLSMLESLVSQRASKRPKKSKNEAKNYENLTPTLPTEPQEKPFISKRLSSPPVTRESKKFKTPRYLKNVQSKIKDDVQKDLAIHRYEKEVLNSPTFRKKCNRSLPELLEVKEPKLCPIKNIENGEKTGLVTLAERFLNNPFTKILSPR